MKKVAAILFVSLFSMMASAETFTVTLKKATPDTVENFDIVFVTQSMIGDQILSVCNYGEPCVIHGAADDNGNLTRVDSAERMK